MQRKAAIQYNSTMKLKMCQDKGLFSPWKFNIVLTGSTDK